MANLPESSVLLFKSQFWLENWCSILQDDAGKR
jgi:hypothetical protein